MGFTRGKEENEVDERLKESYAEEMDGKTNGEHGEGGDR